MNVSEIKQNILYLSDSIARRSEIIEKQSGERNLIEIDLAMEDIRFLYREMERLKLLIKQDYRSSLSSSAQVFEKKPSEEISSQRTPAENHFFDNREKTSDRDSVTHKGYSPVREQKPFESASQTSVPDSQPANEISSGIRAKDEQQQKPDRKDTESFRQNETLPANSGKTETESAQENRTVEIPQQNKTINPTVPPVQKSDSTTPVKSLGETISNKKTVVADKLG
ncbi:MAG: hypothetical protein ACOCW7_04355, partial [Bacteroidota bacterium]